MERGESVDGGGFVLLFYSFQFWVEERKLISNYFCLYSDFLYRSVERIWYFGWKSNLLNAYIRA